MLGVSVIGVCFGALMGVYPGFTADQFGIRHNSVNYGIMFIGFAIAGYFGPSTCGRLLASTGSYTAAFLVAAILAVVGILLAVCLWLYGCGWYSLIPIGLYFELYALEWLIKLPFCLFDRVRSYMSIAFEQEAYEHQAEVYYNDVRRHFVWVKYLFTLTPKRK